MLQQKSRLISLGTILPIFYGPILVSLLELKLLFPVLSWQEQHPVWSSAVAYLLQGSTCCVFRDGILHTLVVMSGYLSYCCLSIISNRSNHSPLTSTRHFCPHNCRSLDMFSFSDHSLRWLCVKIPVDQQFLKYSEQPVWHKQTFHTQSHLKPLSSPFWCSVWTSESHLHHILMPKCIELLPCDWLIINLCYQTIEQVYLIK